MNTLIQYAAGVSEGFCALALPLVVQSIAVLALIWAVDAIVGARISVRGRYWLWVGGLLGSILPFSWFLPIPKMLHARVGYPIFTLPAVLMLAWFIGMAGLTWAVLRRTLQLQAIARQAAPAGGFMQGVFRYCRRSMAVDVEVCLKISPQVESPVVWGLRRPVILLPQDFAPRLGSRHLRAVLLHQFARIKRGDLRINLLQMVMQVVWFFNPLIWLANARIRTLRGRLADEMVLAVMDNHLGWYSEALATVSTPPADNPNPSLTTALVGI
ncbi:MAG TPA: M56 family metallopeptidase [Phycisphaerales bacterium]|nr:M56 family metallopeptidase [Phycisphaerales bacterium]